ncbi:hypothetical protein DCO48_04030 [Pseudomonas sp. SDI]|uniref:14-3-3 family protein n=1 Tax=Pseudomonas sp. SDI TaxID=2170734 RepID=UPI000DE5F1E1|nr:14-3-3 family protein [Pseudomonas sp. SDI]PWB35159.1 hypothetical protein DCO48_04030 [Pseudomonas sp. SDI]
MASSLETTLCQAKMAEQAERYDEMLDMLVDAAIAPEDMTLKIMNLLVVAAQNSVGARRHSVAVIAALEARAESYNDSGRVELIRAYRRKVYAEMELIVTGKVLPVIVMYKKATAVEVAVLAWRMEGDYYRYLHEFQTGVERDVYAEKASSAYVKAMEVAGKNLGSMNSIRLGVVLNYSAYLYEGLQKFNDATALATAAFELAMKELEASAGGGDECNDAVVMLQLLRDNVTRWHECA